MAKLIILILLTLISLALAFAQPTGRIVGGVDALDGQFPHQISLRNRGSHSCGGSIISRNYILTAAHCVGYIDEDDKYHVNETSLYTVRVGSTNRFMHGVVKQVVEIIVHEDYGNFINDVALLKLDSPLVYSNNIQPISLATSEVPDDSIVVISGWGRLKTVKTIPRLDMAERKYCHINAGIVPY